jgi:hypothetical protein
VGAPLEISSWLSARSSPTPPVLHPLSINTLSAAAAEAGAAASWQDQQKLNANVRVEPNCNAVVPFSVKSYGRLGKLAMKLLQDLGDHTAGPGGVTQAPFAAGALRALSVGLVRGSCFHVPCLCWSVYPVTGQTFCSEMTVPSEELLV